ncbi:MAG: trypsin-like serine protease [Polyangia bacterium]
MRHRNGTIASTTIFILATGCVQTSFESPSGPANGTLKPEQKINDGTATNDHPAIGGLDWALGENNIHCTATLIAPRWILTAGHCLDITADTSYFSFHPGNADAQPVGFVQSELSVYYLQQVITFASEPALANCVAAQQAGEACRLLSVLNETLDYTGTDDIALGLLTEPVPNIAPSPESVG